MDVRNHNSSTLQKEIAELISTLQENNLDRLLAKRLQLVLEAIETGQVGGMREKDFNQFYNPNLLVESASKAFAMQNPLPGWLEALRNFLAATLVGFSGLALWQALRAYRELLSENPSMSTPFIALWEQNFLGKLPLSFSQVTAVGIGLVIGVLGVGMAAVSAHQRNARKAEQRAIELSCQVDDLLWHAHAFLQEEHFFALNPHEERNAALLASINRFVESFHGHSVELEKSIQLERQQLEEIETQRKQEYENLANASRELMTISSVYNENALNLSSVLERFESATASLGAEFQELKTTQARINGSLSRLNENFQRFDQLLSGIDQNLAANAASLVQNSGMMMEKSNELIGAVQFLSASTRTFVTEQSEMRQMLAEQHDESADWNKALLGEISQLTQMASLFHKFQPALEESIQRFFEAARPEPAQNDMNQSLTRVTEELAQHIQTFGAQAATLEQQAQHTFKAMQWLATSFPAAAQQFTQLSAPLVGLGKVMNSLSVEIRQLSESNQAALKGYNRLADELKQLQNGSLTPPQDRHGKTE